MWRENSRRVRTHEKNSGETIYRLGTIIQSIFCAQSGASIRLTVWKCPVRVGTQGLFRLCLKTFVAPFLPARLTAPGSLRMSVGKRRRPNHEIVLHPERYPQDSVIPREKSTRIVTVFLRRTQTEYMLARGGVLIFCPQIRR